MVSTTRWLLTLTFAIAPGGFAWGGDAGEKSGKPPSAVGTSLAQLDEKVLADPRNSEMAANLLEAVYQGKPQPENVRMLISILKGGRMGPGSGWFGPSQTRYHWKWLAEFHELESGATTISRQSFRGSAELFQRLDRDRDGALTADDLDFSDSSAASRASAQAKSLFDTIDDDGNGQVTSDEWLKYMKKLTGGKATLEPEDLLPLFAAPKGKGPAGKGKGGAKEAGAMPPQLRKMILKGFFDGDVGSWCEGPALNEAAPDFTLPTPDGKSAITLSQSFGKKPVVLIFGSFT